MCSPKRNVVFNVSSYKRLLTSRLEMYKLDCYKGTSEAFSSLKLMSYRCTVALLHNLTDPTAAKAVRILIICVEEAVTQK